MASGVNFQLVEKWSGMIMLLLSTGRRFSGGGGGAQRGGRRYSVSWPYLDPEDTA